MRSIWVFLVGLFPTEFRRQFGADMVEQIQADYEGERLGGRRRALAFTIATAWDLVRSAVAERRRPTWGVIHAQPAVGSPGGAVMQGWTKDLRHAVRMLLRAPGFTLVTVGTLGLAIGANVGLFSVVDTVLLQPFPFPDADRLIYIRATAPGSEFPDEFGVSAEFYVQYSELATRLESVSTTNTFTSSLRVGDRVERLWMSAPTIEFFQTLGAPPMLGRLPVPEDENGVAVISYALWTSWFGSDSTVVGRTYDMLGSNRTIVGVMGPDFWFPREEIMLWVPNVIRPERVTPGRFGLSLLARMAPETTIDAVTEELTTLARQLPDRFGGSPQYAAFVQQQLRPVVRPLEEQLLGGVSGSLWILLASVGIVLLIACANVANLFLVRAEGRQRELAVRRALGASPMRLFRAALIESVVIAGCAGGVALVLAWVGAPLLIRTAPATVPRLADVGLTGPTLVFTVGACLVAVALCGVVPAIRSSAPSLARLSDGSRGTTRRRHWGRDALVVGQTALALVLLIGSGLLVRSFIALRNVDPGYDTEDVFTFQIAPEDREDLRDQESYAQFHAEFMDRVAALPGVLSVGIVENVPLNESPASGRFLTERSAGDDEGGALLRYTYAAGAYFGTMGIGVVRGRAFDPRDYNAEIGNVIIGRTTAELLWPGEDPIGRRMQQRGSESWETVIGVVEDVMQNDFRTAPNPLVYFPFVGLPGAPSSRPISSPAYVVKTPRAHEIGPEIRALVREAAPGAPMYRTFTMAGLAADSMVRLSFTMLTLGLASAVALILGAVGLFGVLSYVVAERTREIGVRMALGAEAKRVQAMVVGQGARVVAVGVAIGIVAAVGATRVLGNLLFGIAAADLVTFLSMSAAMVLVGMLASYLPARRASSVDPIESLRG